MRQALGHDLCLDPGQFGRLRRACLSGKGWLLVGRVGCLRLGRCARLLGKGRQGQDACGQDGPGKDEGQTVHEILLVIVNLFCVNADVGEKCRG
jgi:hypothetical protein